MPASEIGQRFVQEHLSRSVKATLRGLHFQCPNPQGKVSDGFCVVRCSMWLLTYGLVVQLFGQHVMVELNDENRRQLWVPRGFAHGFIVNSDSADFFYKCDELYSPADESVLRWNDPALRINWGCENPLISGRDREGRTLTELQEKLPKVGIA